MLETTTKINTVTKIDLSSIEQVIRVTAGRKKFNDIPAMEYGRLVRLSLDQYGYHVGSTGTDGYRLHRYYDNEPVVEYVLIRSELASMMLKSKTAPWSYYNGRISDGVSEYPTCDGVVYPDTDSCINSWTEKFSDTIYIDYHMCNKIFTLAEVYSRSKGIHAFVIDITDTSINIDVVSYDGAYRTDFTPVAMNALSLPIPDLFAHNPCKFIINVKYIRDALRIKGNYKMNYCSDNPNAPIVININHFKALIMPYTIKALIMPIRS